MVDIIRDVSRLGISLTVTNNGATALSNLRLNLDAYHYPDPSGVIGRQNLSNGFSLNPGQSMPLTRTLTAAELSSLIYYVANGGHMMFNFSLIDLTNGATIASVDFTDFATVIDSTAIITASVVPRLNTDGTVADINMDGIVDFNDLSYLASAWGTVPGDPLWDARADLNGDGIVNDADQTIFQQYYGDDFRVPVTITLGTFDGFQINANIQNQGNATANLKETMYFVHNGVMLPTRMTSNHTLTAGQSLATTHELSAAGLIVAYTNGEVLEGSNDFVYVVTSQDETVTYYTQTFTNALTIALPLTEAATITSFTHTIT
jgi:hypothetical protein